MGDSKEFIKCSGPTKQNFMFIHITQSPLSQGLFKGTYSSSMDTMVALGKVIKTDIILL